METRWLALALAVAMAVGALAGCAAADKYVVVNTYGYSPFVYSGFSYIPLRSATDFLGAALLWDSLKGQAVITYNGRRLALVVGDRYGHFDDRRVLLPAPVVMVRGRPFVPVVVVREHFGVPVRWEAPSRRLLILGPSGWGAVVVSPHPEHPVRVKYGPPSWSAAGGRKALPPGQAKKLHRPRVVISEKPGKGHGQGGQKGRGRQHD